MNFKEYQEQAKETAVYPDITNFLYSTGEAERIGNEVMGFIEIVPLMYVGLGLAGEAGEVVEQIKKSWRNNMSVTDDRKKKIESELGDVLWYASQIATELRLDFNQIAIDNIGKLQRRKTNGELKHE